MELNAKDIALLELYWKAELAGQERNALEERFNTDADFREAANELQRLQKGLRNIQRRQWKDQMAQFEQKAPALALTKPAWWKKWWILLVWILLLSVLAIWLLSKERKPQLNENQAIAQAAFEHFPYYGATLGTSPQDAIRLYEEDQDYVKAEQAMQTLFQESKDSTYLLYAAIAAVGSNQAEKAIPVLEQLAKSARFETIREDVEWYLALGYLGVGEKKRAKDILRKIGSNSNSTRKKEANVLFQKIIFK
jgi:rubrerythrin